MTESSFSYVPHAIPPRQVAQAWAPSSVCFGAAPTDRLIEHSTEYSHQMRDPGISALVLPASRHGTPGVTEKLLLGLEQQPFTTTSRDAAADVTQASKDARHVRVAGTAPIHKSNCGHISAAEFARSVHVQLSMGAALDASEFYSTRNSEAMLLRAYHSVTRLFNLHI